MNTWLKRQFRTVKTNPSRHRRRHLPLGLETLEDRLTPAVTTFADGVLTIDFNAVNESISTSNNGTTITLNSSAAITGAGNSFATADVTRLVLTDSGDLAGQFVELNGIYTLPNGLSSTGVESVNVDGGIDASGAMGISVTAPKEIAIAGSLTTTDGDIVLSANQQMTPTSGTFIGINVFTGTIGTSGTGDIRLAGRGGDTGSDNLGVRLPNGTAVRSTATGATAGTITIEGNGGAGTTGLTGVLIETAQITSVDGAIQITGQGGAGTADGNVGIAVLESAVVSSTGTGDNAASITIDGTGGAGTASNHGVSIINSVQVTAVDGDIHITGQGGAGTDNANFGIFLVSDAAVSSTGTGAGAATVTIDGTGGGVGDDSGVNFGIILGNSPRITSVDGALAIIAEAGIGSILAIDVGSSNSIVVSGTAPVTLTADGMSIPAGGAIAAGTNTVTLRQKTASTAIGIGSTDVAGVLGLSDAELDNISAGTIRIGDDNTGTITVTAALEHAGDADFVVTTRRNIILMTGTSWTTTDGDLIFNANQQLTPTTGSFVGISINGITLTTNGTGALSLNGRGGDNGGNNNHGIQATNGAKVQSTASGADAGTITLQGTGGAGMSANVGVQIFDLGAQVTSVSGDILIVGQGGAGTINNNRGVRLFGDILVSSTGMGANAATITIEGTGAGNSPNNGVLISGAGSTAKVTSVDGAIQITGTSGAGSSPAIEVLTTGSVASTGTATVTLIGDRLSINATGAIAAGTNAVNLRQKTAATTIDVGGGDAAGVLGLSNDDLNNIVAGVIVIGDATTSALTVSAPITFDNPTGSGPALELEAGGTIDLNATFNTDGGTILVQAAQIRTQADLMVTTFNSGTITFERGILDVGGSPGKLFVQGNLSLGAGLTYHVEIDGPTAGTDHDQIIANNNVDVENPILDLDIGFVPALNQSFEIFSQAGDSPFNGQFAGLSNGALFVEDGLVFQIAYANGGNVFVTRVEAPPTGLVVDNTGDVSDGNFAAGQLTLREAIELANLLEDANNITFDQTVFGTAQTITLTGGQFTLSNEVTITGPGAKRLTLDADGASRHFTVNAFSAAVSGLTLENGAASGANGGSINNLGTLALTECVVRSNTAMFGGGVYNAGSLTVTRCTFNQNSAGFGGGIAHDNGLLKVIGSTFTGQSASTGGAILSDSPLEVTDSTISGNTDSNGAGGIRTLGALTLTNSIVAGNMRGAAAGDIAGTVTTDGGHNLIGTGGSGGLVNGTNFNLVGVDPLLGPLADNGGPTPTMALLTGSPAIDAGGPSGPMGTDQRGFTRPFDVTGVANAADGRDIGAFEQQTLSLTANSTADTVDPNDGVLTLREALLAALANPGADTITLDPSLGGQTITLTGSLPQITSDVTIIGPAGGLSLDARGMSKILRIGEEATATLSNLNFLNGLSTVGAGIENIGTLNLIDCGFSGNRSALGAGVYNNGDLTLTNCTFTDNVANSRGGAVYNQNMLAVTGSTFSGNSAGVEGGGIFNTGTMTLAGSTLSGNSSNSGGGIFNEDTLTLTNATLSGNEAQVHGGGISNKGTLTVVNSTIVLNKDDQADTSGPSGGGIYQSAGSLTLSNTLVAGNLKGVSPSTPSDIVVDGGSVSGSNNLIGDPDSAGGLSAANGNILGDGSGGLLAIEQIIDIVLSDNGGATLTHALVTGSRAIDGGDTALALDALGAPLTADQRGPTFDRVNGPSVDIGAFESDAVFSGGFDGAELDDEFNLTAGRFSIVNGQAVAQGNKPAQAILDGVNLPDVAVELDVTLAGNGSRGGVLARYSPRQGNRSESYYWARLIRRNGQVRAEILRYSNGKVKKLASVRVVIQGNSAHLRLEVSGSSLTLFVDGTQQAAVSDNGLMGAGGVGIRARKGAALDNLVVNPLLAALRRQDPSGLGAG